MNVDNIQLLINKISTLSRGHNTGPDEKAFDMSSVLHDCGTPACIAGWALALRLQSEGPELESMIDEYRVAHPEVRERASIMLGTEMSIARDFLGLDNGRAKDLFHADGVSSFFWEKIEPEAAVKVLQHLINTGKVDWSVAELPEDFYLRPEE